MRTARSRRASHRDSHDELNIAERSRSAASSPPIPARSAAACLAQTTSQSAPPPKCAWVTTSTC
jgi:hypothetical protein